MRYTNIKNRNQKEKRLVTLFTSLNYSEENSLLILSNRQAVTDRNSVTVSVEDQGRLSN